MPKRRLPKRLTRSLVLGCTALALAATTQLAPAEAATPTTAATATHRTGTLADGATWIADVPAHWNGTLLLFSHGYGPTVAQDAPTPAIATELLTEGYALAGSSYDPNGSWWALGSAERDQFATRTAFSAAVGRPTRTISVGESMGGLVNAQIDRDSHGRIAGSLNICGLVAGGIDLNDYQLEAEYTLATLLDPADQGDLTGYASADAAAAVATRLTAAITTAQTTAQGRARIALAAAYLNLPGWAPGNTQPAADDAAGQEQQQYDWFTQQGELAFIVSARISIEQAAGGDSGSTAGVDYARLLRSSGQSAEVSALYKTAGLKLGSDLDTLNSGPRYHANPAATRWMEQTSTAGQSLGDPLLDLHTTADQLVPVQQETAFAQRVDASGDGALLKQAYVSRQSHCNFTTAEVVAGLHAVVHRVDTGSWGDTTTPAALQSAADALDLDGAAFIPFRPGHLVGSLNPSPFAPRL